MKNYIKNKEIFVLPLGGNARKAITLLQIKSFGTLSDLFL